MATAKPSVGRVDYARLNATDEAQVCRQATEDGDRSFDGGRFAEPPESIRKRLGLNQIQFAAAIRIPLATLRNWEQKRTKPDLAAMSLLRLVASDPEFALRVLAA